MSANTTPEEFDTFDNKSFDLSTRSFVESIHESKINQANNDFYIRIVEVI